MSKQRQPNRTPGPERPRTGSISKFFRAIARASWFDFFMSLTPVLIIGVLVVLVGVHYMRSTLPRTLTISGGPEGSLLDNVADHYSKILARSGIKVKVMTSTGSRSNLERLINPHSGVDVALVQGGVSAPGDTTGIVSLGSIFYEPMAVFYRGAKPLDQLTQLRGQRIAIGVPGSGTRALALTLLKANGITPGGPTALEPLEGASAVDALLHGSVDAIFLSGDSATLANFRRLMHSPGVHIFDFTRADAYVRRFRYLSKLTVPTGTFDLTNNLPAHPINMLAPTMNMLVRSGMNPALSDLLIGAARQVDGRGTLFQRPGEFPAPLRQGWPISSEAERFYKSGQGFLYRFLPFWLASLLNQLWVVLVPLVVVGLPALEFLPTFYHRHAKSRIYRHYGRLMALERDALDPAAPTDTHALLARLDDIEGAVIRLKLPAAFADQLYVLRQHILFVRTRLATRSLEATPQRGSPDPDTPET